MTAFAIVFGAGSVRRYLKISDAPAEGEVVGYRPLTWTADRARAEQFGSEDAARRFAEANLGHDRFAVVALPPTSRRSPPSGGTPILMRIAA